MKPQSGLSHFISKVLGGVASLKVFWREWNVQTIVITSLTLQLILILFGSFRQRTSNGIIIASIWLSYLLADWVAAQGVGLISKVHDDLFAFWAQFLLLHLGGPDTITALAVEDNNLWPRTGLHLGVQVYTTLGILVNSIQHSRLWIPTILMFLAGVIKYLERLSALLYGRTMNFDQEPNHLVAYEPQIAVIGPPTKDRTNFEMVRDAFYLFNYYKGLYADRDITYAMRVRSCSKNYFEWIRTSADAFNVLEIQFSFAYEALYTKMGLVQTSTCWKILRPVVMSVDVACLVIWCSTKKHGFHPHDIRITYGLLIGAIFVDVLSIFRIQWSYWSIVHLKEGSKIRRWGWMLSAWNHARGGYWRNKETAPFQLWFRRAICRRWSESVSQLNLLSLLIDESFPTKMMKKVAAFFGVKDALDGFIYVNNKWVSDHLRDFIFNDLKCKSKWTNYDLQKVRFICSAKGNYAYHQLTQVKRLAAFLDASKEYESVLLHWHVITELMYCEEIQISDDDDDDDDELTLFKRLVSKVKKKVKGKKTTKTKTAEQDQEGTVKLGMKEYREISKTLSDYAMYFLLQHPVMMSSVVKGTYKQMIVATIDAARQKIVDLLPKEKEEPELGKSKSKQTPKQVAYGRFGFRHQISVGKEDSTPPPPDPPIRCWAEFPYSIHPALVDIEAWEEEHGRESKWKFMAEVWAELVYYAAIRCKPSVHAAQLKHGGELLSFIWLLMVQLGFGLHGSEHEALQFHIPERHDATTNVVAPP